MIPQAKIPLLERVQKDDKLTAPSSTTKRTKMTPFAKSVYCRPSAYDRSDVFGAVKEWRTLMERKTMLKVDLLLMRIRMILLAVAERTAVWFSVSRKHSKVMCDAKRHILYAALHKSTIRVANFSQEY
jgi:hypothetical protein